MQRIQLKYWRAAFGDVRLSFGRPWVYSWCWWMILHPTLYKLPKTELREY